MINNRIIRVFLGSSSAFNYSQEGVDEDEREKKDALKQIVTELEKRFQTVQITPWWELPRGDYTIYDFVLTHITASDFCIFVLADDLKLDSEDSEEEYVPNSNVIFEAGIAYSKGKRVMLLKWDPKSKIDLPSDIDGKFYSTVSKTGQKKLNLERIITDFEKILSNYMDDRLGKLASTKYNDIDVYYDKALSVQLQNPTPDASWGTKALYLGSKSADLWTKMEERSYAESSAIDKFLKTATWKDGKKKRSIKDLAIDNIISFGPGAGTIDKNLISYFTKDSFKPFYIPIDISISLITRAIDRIGTKASYPVPFAILDDFEQGTCFDRLGDLIKSNEHKIHKQSLFSILGVTFSNYSQPESEFLKAIARLMREKEDYLLLDVVAGIPPEGGAFVRRVRNQLTGRRLQELIVHSIRKRYPNLRGADDNELVNNVKIVKQSAESDRYHVLTKLNKTQIVEYVYNDGTNDVPLLTLKAYDYGEFKDSLTEFFDIQACSLDTKYKRGIFLLSKKSV